MKAFSRSFMLRYFKSFENHSHSVGIIHGSSFNLPMQAKLSLYYNFYPYLSLQRRAILFCEIIDLEIKFLRFTFKNLPFQCPGGFKLMSFAKQCGLIFERKDI